MADDKPEDVTLTTLHQDFADLKGEIRTGFGDMKATMIAGFRSMPTREQSDEMIRLLREGNRLNEERFAQLDARIREQRESCRVMESSTPTSGYGRGCERYRNARPRSPGAAPERCRAGGRWERSGSPRSSAPRRSRGGRAHRTP